MGLIAPESDDDEVIIYNEPKKGVYKQLIIRDGVLAGAILVGDNSKAAGLIQEYEAKINSGDPLAIAEVVRDLHRNAGQPDQSFSERQIYEAAMDRLAAELGALDNTDKAIAMTKLSDYLSTIQKGAPIETGEGDDEADLEAEAEA